MPKDDLVYVEHMLDTARREMQPLADQLEAIVGKTNGQ